MKEDLITVLKVFCYFVLGIIYVLPILVLLTTVLVLLLT